MRQSLHTVHMHACGLLAPCFLAPFAMCCRQLSSVVTHYCTQQFVLATLRAAWMIMLWSLTRTVLLCAPACKRSTNTCADAPTCVVCAARSTWQMTRTGLRVMRMRMMTMVQLEQQQQQAPYQMAGQGDGRSCHLQCHCPVGTCRLWGFASQLQLVVRPA